ncbi:hypothetical protein HK100_006342, partial [Physocladia obscura]
MGVKKAIFFTAEQNVLKAIGTEKDGECQTVDKTYSDGSRKTERVKNPSLAG